MARQAELQKAGMDLAGILSTSMEPSRIAMGTWAIGGWMWGGTDEVESIVTIRAAVEHGINIIDTAPAYGFGRSEEIVGKALAEGNLRSRVLIATKVGLEWEGGRVFRNASRARILQEINESLRRLRTDYIDMYQVHWPDPLVTIEETAEAMHTCSSRARSAPSASATFQSDRWSGSAGLRHCMCCSHPIACLSAASSPISCPIAANTISRRLAMARCAAVSSLAGCG